MLSGAVRSQAVAVRLVLFASAYGLSNAAVVNNLSFDVEAPAAAGVRIIELDSAHFAAGSEEISADQARQLDRLVFVMAANPDTELHIVGNTDPTGNEVRDFAVSQREAEAVVAYLVSRGIDPGRLTTQPAGASNPLGLEQTADASGSNRRVDFVIFGLLDG
jgi:outer membrane protein OmpA-like peptidoglycan-associated protein